MAKKKKRREMTDRELRDYYDTHSAMEKGPLRPVKIDFPRPRVLIAMRLDDEILIELKKVAARKGLNYSTLARMWIAEKLREERA
jgi:predicted DNA binding CopG/RHH family protein